MHKDELPIGTTCEESWDAMRGDTRRRHCDSCARDVYDLSAMTRREAQAVIARRAAGQRVCVRYAFDDAGQLEFQREPLLPVALLTRGRQLALSAGLAAAVISGCMPAGSAVGSAASHSVAEELGERGACSVSLEPLLPLSVNVHATGCEPRPLEPKSEQRLLGQLAVPPAPQPLPEPPPPPPAPKPASSEPISEVATREPTKRPPRRANKVSKQLAPPRRVLMGDML